MNVISLILAGGSGTRLWPLSRQTMPKQLLALTGNRTLLQDTCRRLWPITPPKQQWIITGKEYYHQVVSQVRELQPDLASQKESGSYIEVLAEPIGKNTAPAIFWAARRFQKLYGENAILIVSPSDNLITIEEAYIKNIERGIAEAAKGNFVTFGIQPNHPEVAYGYIRAAEAIVDQGVPYAINAFVEKPDLVSVKEYLAEGNYLWNSGIFIFQVGALLREGIRLCPDIAELFINSDPMVAEDVANAYRDCQAKSIDYALMEKTDLTCVIPASFGWIDVGSWGNLFKISEKDEDGNVVKGEHIIIDTNDSFIYGTDRLIAAIGLEKMAVIDTPDALMVCPLNQTERVKEIVQQLEQQNSKKHIEHQTVERPWGSYTVIQEGFGYKIKKIVVKPKHKLSLQMHYHRSEHWIVVRGAAKITNGTQEIIIHENESTYIPKATVHRLENPGLVPLEIIEAQCGAYLEEDDIVRFEDSYGRLEAK